MGKKLSRGQLRASHEVMYAWHNAGTYSLSGLIFSLTVVTSQSKPLCGERLAKNVRCLLSPFRCSCGELHALSEHHLLHLCMLCWTILSSLQQPSPLFILKNSPIRSLLNFPRRAGHYLPPLLQQRPTTPCLWLQILFLMLSLTRFKIPCARVYGLFIFVFLASSRAGA